MYYLAFDCETTGLLPKCNVLTVYFIILDSQLNKLDELDIKIKYDYYLIFTAALTVNKINLIEHDKIAITKSEAIKQILNFLNKYNTNNEMKYHIIGHNITFDINMLLSNNILTNSDVSKYFDKNNYFDTFKIAKLLKSKQKINKCQSLSLSKLCYYFDINLDDDENFHNCKYDTESTVQLFKKLIELQQSN